LALKERESAGASSITALEVDTLANLYVGHPTRIAKVDTVKDVVRDSRDIEHLMRQQFAALQRLFNLPRVAVIGPAVSGKTVLALWRLEPVLKEGGKALYLCFNKNLGAHLRGRNPLLPRQSKTSIIFFMSWRALLVSSRRNRHIRPIQARSSLQTCLGW